MSFIKRIHCNCCLFVYLFVYTVQSPTQTCDLDETCCSDELSSRTFNSSELCCYCAAKAEENKYCQCSTNCLSEAGREEAQEYMNTSLCECERDGGICDEEQKYCQCSADVLSLRGDSRRYANGTPTCKRERETTCGCEDGVVAIGDDPSGEGGKTRPGASRDGMPGGRVNPLVRANSEEGAEEENGGKLKTNDYLNAEFLSAVSSDSKQLSAVIPTTFSLEGRSSSVTYLPVVWASADYLPLLHSDEALDRPTSQKQSDEHLLREDTQSLCSVCKCSPGISVEEGVRSSEHQGCRFEFESPSTTPSTESVCGRCREELLSEDCRQQWTVSRPKPHVLPLHLKPSSDDPRAPGLPVVGKAKVEHQPSNDSGVLTMTSESASFLGGIWSQKSSLSEAFEFTSDLDEVVASLELEGGVDEIFSCDGTGERPGEESLQVRKLQEDERASRQIQEVDEAMKEVERTMLEAEAAMQEDRRESQDVEKVGLEVEETAEQVRELTRHSSGKVFSAHPRFKALFGKLGIVESDV